MKSASAVALGSIVAALAFAMTAAAQAPPRILLPPDVLRQQQEEEERMRQLRLQQQPQPPQQQAPGTPQQQPGQPQNPQAAGNLSQARLSDTTPFLLPNVSLTEMIDVLAKRLKINYILDPGVKGSVTIYTYGEVKPVDLMALLETILRVN
ncbi:MAG TPA: hypothetical protein VGF59_35425, partial [Bryobacteraceae bacterium]